MNEPCLHVVDIIERDANGYPSLLKVMVVMPLEGPQVIVTREVRAGADLNFVVMNPTIEMVAPWMGNAAL